MLPVKLLGDAKQPWKSMDSFKSTFGTFCTNIAQTVDLIKLLITSRLTTELFYLINKFFSKTTAVEKYQTRFRGHHLILHHPYWLPRTYGNLNSFLTTSMKLSQFMAFNRRASTVSQFMAFLAKVMKDTTLKIDY